MFDNLDYNLFFTLFYIAGVFTLFFELIVLLLKLIKAKKEIVIVHIAPVLVVPLNFLLRYKGIIRLLTIITISILLYFFKVSNDEIIAILANTQNLINLYFTLIIFILIILINTISYKQFEILRTADKLIFKALAFKVVSINEIVSIEQLEEYVLLIKMQNSAQYKLKIKDTDFLEPKNREIKDKAKRQLLALQKPY